MAKIRVGCKRSLVSSKNGSAYLLLADVKTTTKTYQAFDIPIKEEGKEGKEEIDVLCPYCDSSVKMRLERERPSKDLRDMAMMFVIIWGIFSLVIFLVNALAGFIVMGLLFSIFIFLKKSKPSNYKRDSIVGFAIVCGIFIIPLFLQKNFGGLFFIFFIDLFFIIGIYLRYIMHGGKRQKTYIKSLFSTDQYHLFELKL